MDKSIFSEKNKKPGGDDLKVALGDSLNLWLEIYQFVHEKYPAASDEWNYAGDKYGWSFRVKDKKRAIVYLLPRDKYFKVAFVFGQQAFDEIMKAKVSENIKTELAEAKVYAEGRGIRIDVVDNKVVKDIKILVEIKLAH